MKYSPQLLLIFLLFFNCDNEPVDTSIFVEEEIIHNPIFIDAEGIEHHTGGDCINPSGEFDIGAFVIDDLEIPSNLPQEYDLSEYLPPIGNQGSQSSCVSWATGYYLKSMQEKIQNGYLYDNTNIMSPAYLYNQITQGNCSSTLLTSTLQLIKDKGVCSIDIFPYNQNACSQQPTIEQDEIAMNIKISDYLSLSGINMVDEMKTLILQQTPVIISTVLDDEFGKMDILNLTAYRDHQVTYQGASCHTMLVVGYSDFYNAFKVVNSWGTNWGDLGFVWIDYKAFENVSLPEGTPFKVITQAYIAYDE